MTTMKYIPVLLALLSIISTISLDAQSKWQAPDNPIELGQVHWLRNYDDALAQSEESGLPIFILFQEVPGCSNCTTYGNEVLSHPFMVEMIETHFVPLAIFNNKGGHDREVLKKYNEPTWNNPVVRIVNHKGKDLVNRLSGDFSKGGLANKVSNALQLTNQVEPKYFSIWKQELKGEKNQEEAYLSMFCFWTGEKEIAKIPGVLSTEAGFMHGKEVVKVEYDKAQTNLNKIVKVAKKKSVADQVFADKSVIKNADKKVGKYRVDREVKYYLSKTKYKSIPMTPLQAAKVNSLIGQGQNPNDLLSPRQLALLSVDSSNKNLINQDFVSSWYDVIAM